ncbi:very short patch repair endonuclease [Streptomyces sp. NPDC101221]|uniref:very short patch repair endonuclease n=1 Tax=Streptomyces sp. NPDC101221 TaxID=3366132 RepID=UPI0037FB9233
MYRLGQLTVARGPRAAFQICLPPQAGKVPLGTIKRMDPSTTSWATSSRTRASMQGNRSRDTRPELALRQAAHRLRLRYRVSTRPLPELPRTADMVFTRARVAVFVDGCFWHGCPTHYTPSKSNVTYWTEKIIRNKERDEDTNRRLREAGWLVIRIWEHEDLEVAARKLKETVTDRLALCALGKGAIFHSEAK